MILIEARAPSGQTDWNQLIDLRRIVYSTLTKIIFARRMSSLWSIFACQLRDFHSNSSIDFRLCLIVKNLLDIKMVAADIATEQSSVVLISDKPTKILTLHGGLLWAHFPFTVSSSYQWNLSIFLMIYFTFDRFQCSKKSRTNKVNMDSNTAITIAIGLIVQSACSDCDNRWNKTPVDPKPCTWNESSIR